ncbi:ferritin, partial [Patescibacteria group bacterium]|nr:ferritin [Patescibacteria group bacterium]
MLTDKMREALNKQVNAELFSAYLYMAMSADFTDKNLAG